MAEDLQNNGSEETYGDMLGTEIPAEIDAEIKPGEVALSIPRKIEPVQRPKTVLETGPKAEASPEPEVVERIFSEPVMSEDGVELTVPPLVVRDGKRNFEEDVKPLFVKPLDQEKVLETENVEKTGEKSAVTAENATNVFEGEEMPSFIKSWKTDSEEENLDDILAKVLDEDSFGEVLAEEKTESGFELNLDEDLELPEMAVAEAAAEGENETNVIPEFNFDEILAETKETEIETAGGGDPLVLETAESQDILPDEHTIPPLDLLSEFNVEIKDEDVALSVTEADIQSEAEMPAPEENVSEADTEALTEAEAVAEAEPELEPEPVSEPEIEAAKNEISEAEPVVPEMVEEPEIEPVTAAVAVEETPAETAAEKQNEPEDERRIFNKNGAVQRFVAVHKNGIIELTDIDDGELVNWNLLLFSSVLRNVSAEEDIMLPLPDKTFRRTEIRQEDGSSLTLYNQEKYCFADRSEDVLEQTSVPVILKNAGSVWMQSNDWRVQNLENAAGKTLTFETPQEGILTGPDGAVLFFGGVRAIIVPTVADVKENQERNMKKIAKFFAGSLDDHYAEYNAENLGGEFGGNVGQEAIHLNVGSSTYGWSVHFDNGLVMALSDLREYQLRHGKLPMASGSVIYGKKQLYFRNAARIVYYEVPQYVSYR